MTKRKMRSVQLATAQLAHVRGGRSLSWIVQGDLAMVRGATKQSLYFPEDLAQSQD